MKIIIVLIQEEMENLLSSMILRKYLKGVSIMKKQLFGSVDSVTAKEIEQEAQTEVRSINNFVGILIKKGWECYKRGTSNA
jgi:hypothetical protein